MKNILFDEVSFWHRIFRVSSSASLAAFVTGLLLLMMCSLIAMEPPEIIEATTDVIDIVMPKDRKIIEQPTPPVEKPVDPAPPPEMPKTVENFDNTQTLEITIAPPVNPGKMTFGNGLDSGSAMPIFKVAPQYPRRPQTKGIEGFVDLMFDIGPTGKTQNIRVLYAEPQGLFERASIRALKKWKYKPAMNDGVAQVQKNQTTRIRFNLND